MLKSINKLFGDPNDPTKMTVAVHSTAALAAVVKAVNTYVTYRNLNK